MYFIFLTHVHIYIYKTYFLIFFLKTNDNSLSLYICISLYSKCSPCLFSPSALWDDLTLKLLLLDSRGALRLYELHPQDQPLLLCERSSDSLLQCVQHKHPGERTATPDLFLPHARDAASTNTRIHIHHVKLLHQKYPSFSVLFNRSSCETHHI